MVVAQAVVEDVSEVNAEVVAKVVAQVGAQVAYNLAAQLLILQLHYHNRFYYEVEIGWVREHEQLLLYYSDLRHDFDYVDDH